MNVSKSPAIRIGSQAAQRDLFQDQMTAPEREVRELNLEAVRGTLDELFVLARRYRKSQKFCELLEFVAQFRRYSAFNAMLVHIQMPGAIYVLPAKRWANEYGRLPIEGAQPLVMLQPKSPVMFGFDVSQTEGRPLPAGFENPFEARGHIDEDMLSTVIGNARRGGVKVNVRALGSVFGGYVRNANDPYHCIGFGSVLPMRALEGEVAEELPVFAEITLNGNFDPATSFATLSHELGHLYCGHVGTPNQNWWPARVNLDKTTKEFEAESVSYIVCRRAGIDTPAAEYLNGYFDNNEDVPKISLQMIFKAAQRIEALMSGGMRRYAVGREEE